MLLKVDRSPVTHPKLLFWTLIGARWCLNRLEMGEENVYKMFFDVVDLSGQNERWWHIVCDLRI